MSDTSHYSEPYDYGEEYYEENIRGYVERRRNEEEEEGEIDSEEPFNELLNEEARTINSEIAKTLQSIGFIDDKFWGVTVPGRLVRVFNLRNLDELFVHGPVVAIRIRIIGSFFLSIGNQIRARLSARTPVLEEDGSTIITVFVNDEDYERTKNNIRDYVNLIKMVNQTEAEIGFNRFVMPGNDIRTTARGDYELKIRENKIIWNGDVFYRREALLDDESYESREFQQCVENNQKNRDRIESGEYLNRKLKIEARVDEKYQQKTNQEKEIDRLKKITMKLKHQIEVKEREVFQTKKPSGK